MSRGRDIGEAIVRPRLSIPGRVMLTVLALNLLGDWLRDHLDPKLRNL